MIKPRWNPYGVTSMLAFQLRSVYKKPFDESKVKRDKGKFATKEGSGKAEDNEDFDPEVDDPGTPEELEKKATEKGQKAREEADAAEAPEEAEPEAEPEAEEDPGFEVVDEGGDATLDALAEKIDRHALASAIKAGQRSEGNLEVHKHLEFLDANTNDLGEVTGNKAEVMAVMKDLLSFRDVDLGDDLNQALDSLNNGFKGTKIWDDTPSEVGQTGDNIQELKKLGKSLTDLDKGISQLEKRLVKIVSGFDKQLARELEKKQSEESGIGVSRR